MTTFATKWATDSEIAAAEQAFPRDVRDQLHIIKIMAETGLSRGTATLALAIMRGDSEGDVVEVAD
ncbi:MAG TPA: hypothetical protein VIO85_01700 [Candidatus Dormibacteraeota bacterium]